jgi:hypothetical protein
MNILISILGHKVQFNKKAPDGAFLLRSVSRPEISLHIGDLFYGT